MTAPLSPAISRALALALLFALLLLLFTGIVHPLFSAYADARSAAVQWREAIAHAEATSRNPAALQAEVAQIKARQRSAVGFLHSTNNALAAAELQDRLKMLVESVHGELRSTQILPARDEGKVRRITIRGQISTDIAGLQRVFYQLESTEPMLFLDNVEIRPRRTWRLRAASEDGGIEAQFDLYGYMRGPS